MKKLITMLLTMGLLTLLGLGGVAYRDRYKDDKNSKDEKDDKMGLQEVRFLDYLDGKSDGGVAYVDRYKDDKNSKGDVGLVMLMIAIGTIIVTIMW
jgi:hypothetical protein